MRKTLLIQIITFFIAVLAARAQAPLNDTFAYAEFLSGSTFSVSNNNQFATTENGETSATGLRTLWYTWTAPASGQATITTAGSDNFAIYLTVWMGNSVSTVRSVVSTSGNISSIELAAVAGTTYYLCTGSYYSGQYGNIQINLSLNASSSLDTLNFIGT